MNSGPSLLTTVQMSTDKVPRWSTAGRGEEGGGELASLASLFTSDHNKPQRERRSATPVTFQRRVIDASQKIERMRYRPFSISGENAVQSATERERIFWPPLWRYNTTAAVDIVLRLTFADHH